MSKFADDFTAYIKEIGFNVIRFADIKNGVLEEVTLKPSSLCQNAYSDAKVFVVTAAGLLYDEGRVKPEDRIIDLLGEDCPKKINPVYSDVTLGMALGHSAGFEEGLMDIDRDDSNIYGEDYLEYILNTKPSYMPGTDRIYSDAAYYLAARSLENVCGESLEDYLWRKCLKEMNFREVAWAHCPKGHVIGATGLYVYAGDMAKLAVLYMDGGVYNGKRLLSEKWVDIVINTPYEIAPAGFGECHTKGAMYSQMLGFDAKHKLAFAWHAYDDMDPEILVDFISKYGD